jgi:hypothetical protein
MSSLPHRLWDKHPNGPYLELIEKAFAGGKNALRHSHYKKGSVKFDQLVFHLESPAGELRLKFKRLYLYILVISVIIVWCIGKPLSSSITSCISTSIAYKHKTDIYPLLNT